MAEEILFLTELFGLKVYDLKGRKLGVVKDAAIVPLVDPVRVDRFLLSGDGTLLSIRFDQVKTDRKSTRLNSSHSQQSRMPSSA